MYAALIVPLFLTMVLFENKNRWTIAYLFGLVGALLAVFGSHSATGKIGITVAILFGTIFCWRYLLKYIKFIIPAVGFCFLVLFVFNSANHNIIISKLQNAVRIEKVQPALTDIQTKDDCIVIDYSGNSLKLQSIITDTKTMAFHALDQGGQAVSLQLNKDGTYTVLDDRFPGFILTPCIFDKEIYGFNVIIDDRPWYFSNDTGDGKYYYINRYGKFDKIEKAPSAVFTGYENIFTNRGYMWSRTIPLLKKYPILGIGANNFILAFPQKDYVSQYNSNHGDEKVTRPHNLYLQIAIQYGVAALIAFLVFYLWYFVTAVKLYIKGRFDNPYSIIGLGILTGTVGYMICGITNDSIIAVAPVFWAMVGIGIAANSRVKHLLTH